jgi:hypothetical protein
MAPFHAGSKQIDALSLVADARIQLLEIKTMLPCAAFYQVSFGNVGVVGY